MTADPSTLAQRAQATLEQMHQMVGLAPPAADRFADVIEVTVPAAIQPPVPPAPVAVDPRNPRIVADPGVGGTPSDASTSQAQATADTLARMREAVGPS